MDSQTQTPDPMVSAFASMPAPAAPTAASPTNAGQKSQMAAPQDSMDAAFAQLHQQGVDPAKQSTNANDDTVTVMDSEGKPHQISKSSMGVEDFANSVIPGAAKGLGETAHTIGRLINAATGDNIKWLPSSIEQPKSLESKNPGETFGKIEESIAEFALGDEALKGLSIAEKLGIAQKISEFAQKSPTLAKLLNLGLNATRGATAGGITGGLHEGVQGVETGAIAGAGGEVAGEVGGKALSKAKSLLFPSEEVSQQVVKDSIRKVLGSKVDADVADEIASRVKKESILSPMENELKLAKASLDEDLPKLNSALDQTLSTSTAKTGNAARIVNRTFDDAIGGVNTGVGTNKPEAISAINEVRKEVLSKLTNDPMGAQQVNDVKRLVGDQIKKFAPPENLSSVDAHKKEAYRQAYFSLRDIVSELSPESKPLNAKISRAISAQDVLEKKFPQLETSGQAQASHAGEIRQNKIDTAKKLGKAAAVGAAGAAGAGAVYEGAKVLQ